MRIFTSFVVVLLTVSLGLNSALLVSAQDNSLSRDFAYKTAANFVNTEAVLMGEEFAYSVGQLTDASGGANVSGGNWTTNTGTGNFIPVTAGSLNYTGYTASTGNKIQLTATTSSAEDAFRNFTPHSAGTVYAAFMVRVVDTNLLPPNSSTTGDYFAGFISSTSTSNFADRVTIRQGVGANTFQMGFRATGNAANVQTFSSTDLPAGTTILVVISYQFVDGTANDVTKLWVNPALGGPEPPATIEQVSAADSADIGRFFVRQGSGGGFSTPNAEIDGIRIGTAWADVAGGGGGGPLPGPKLFKANLSGAQEVPPVTTTARGFGRIVLNPTETSITASLYYTDLGSNITLAHIHGPAMPGVNAGVIFDMMPATGVTSGSTINKTFAVTPQQVSDLKAGLWYFNVHTVNNGGGEIRGQITRNKPRLDMDADGDSDYGIIRAGAGGLAGQATWWTSLSSGTPSDPFIMQQWGLNSDVATPADFDGDGKTDHAFWRPSGAQPAFFVLRSTTMTMQQIDFGLPGDDPSIVGDYSGDGLADAAIYRPGATASAQSEFWVLPTSGPLQGVQVVSKWGLGSDIAVPGDYDGDGRFDLCVSRVIGGQNTYIVFTSQGQVSYNPFGLGTDRLAPGDYDGDGITDFAVTRTEGGIVWYYRPSSGGNDVRIPWGASSDIEAQGDYDGDGSTDTAVWRPETNNSMFYVLTSKTGNLLFQRWGIPADVPSIYDLHGE